MNQKRELFIRKGATSLMYLIPIVRCLEHFELTNKFSADRNPKTTSSEARIKESIFPSTLESHIVDAVYNMTSEILMISKCWKIRRI